MRIVVPIKQVPETNAVRMDERTGTMIREGVEAIVNPLDLYGVELAIRLAEEHGGKTVALTMGPPNAVRALREVMAMGIDEGVLVTDRRFAGSDTWATSYVLAAAIRKLGSFDLVICGERATDGDTGQVGPAIAAFLGLPVVTYVAGVERVGSQEFGVGSKKRPGTGPQAASLPTPDSQLPTASLRLRRLVEDGYELLEMATPGVLTVVKEVADPRLPTFRGKQRAKAAGIPSWGAEDLDVDFGRLGLEGSPTRVVKIFKPTVARKCELLTPADEAGIEAACDRLVEFLAERQLI
jgi:electron transfer flavoprotein beta subunit